MTQRSVTLYSNVIFMITVLIMLNALSCRFVGFTCACTYSFVPFAEGVSLRLLIASFLLWALWRLQMNSFKSFAFFTACNSNVFRAFSRFLGNSFRIDVISTSQLSCIVELWLFFCLFVEISLTYLTKFLTIRSRAWTLLDSSSILLPDNVYPRNGVLFN